MRITRGGHPNDITAQLLAEVSKRQLVPEGAVFGQDFMIDGLEKSDEGTYVVVIVPLTFHGCRNVLKIRLPITSE